MAAEPVVRPVTSVKGALGLADDAAKSAVLRAKETSA
jgi:hypothetical protein